MIKVTIIENDTKVLRFLTALLGGADSSEGIQLIGSYDSGQKALAEMPGEVPDVLITELNLDDVTGLEVIRTVTEKFPTTGIIVHTSYYTRDDILSAFRAGASGYLLKGTSSTGIINAIKEVMKGGAPMSPKVSRYVIEEFRAHRAISDVLLTQREKDVLNGFANGHSKATLAGQLSISPHTVHAHTKKIYRKLKIKSKAEAIIKAREKGLI